MRSTIFASLVTALLLTVATPAQAQFTTEIFDNADLDGGSLNCFDVGTLLFDTITSSSLTSMNDIVDGYGHGSSEYVIEVLVSANWQTIYTQNIVGGANTPFSVIPTPINFTSANISGVRLRGIPPDSCTFHSVEAGMSFTFDGSVAESIPIPGLSNSGRLALVLALLMTGLYLRRRILSS